jgi:hypothetical protein
VLGFHITSSERGEYRTKHALGVRDAPVVLWQSFSVGFETFKDVWFSFSCLVAGSLRGREGTLFFS